ncbi:Stomatal closure-related actin-binding protein 1 [Zea mays]|uniref:Stomatal closure-related actin-binding protein 1 n=1 Tax=Zea mays TaxID=4577 RepID=A0A3L6E9W4_MAIZE|nr:Stomatal closure-related actin-binding protein 1 [Zea mays]
MVAPSWLRLSRPTPAAPAFCDAGLPIDRRVDDLVSRMTVAKKTSQLGDQSPAIPRLGVPAYKWWSEALHGISSQGRGIHLDGPLRAATSYHRSSSPPRPSTRTSGTASARAFSAKKNSKEMPRVLAPNFTPTGCVPTVTASTDAKRIIDEERSNARLEIGIEVLKLLYKKFNQHLKSRKNFLTELGSSISSQLSIDMSYYGNLKLLVSIDKMQMDVDELKEEVQEAPRVKMLHCPSKAMDIENEIQVLCDQLAKKSSDSLRLLKELELHRSYGENDMPLYELKGLETLGSTLHIVVHDCASVDFWNSSIQWFRIQPEGSKKEII